MCGSPDLFTRNCTADLCRKVGYNTYNETSCQLSSSAAESYSGPNSGNDAFVGIYGGKWTFNNTTTYAVEGLQTQLSNALVNGQKYVISFWSKVNNNYAGLGTAANRPATIDFHTFPNLLLLTGNLTSALSTFAPSAYKLGNSVQIPNDGKWHYRQEVFTYNGPAGNSFLGTHYNIFSSIYSNNTQLDLYAFLDDITLNSFGSISIISNPAPICLGQSVSNLSSYVSIPGGNFSGPGVVFSHNQYSFNSAGLTAGNHSVFYTYTDIGTGCVYRQAMEITILNGTVGVNNPGTSICAGTCATLTPTITGTAPFTYSWNTIPATTASSFQVCPTLTKSYQLTVTNALGCTAVSNANVIVIPVPALTVSSPSICAGVSSTITASGATTYSWSPSAGLSCTNCANPIINSNSLLTYSVTGTTNGCIATRTVSVKTSPSLTVSAVPPIICLGGTSVLNASGANTYQWSTNAGNSITASVNVTPTSTTVYTVIGTNTINCASSKTISVVTCTPNACSYVVNGSFENVLDCSMSIGSNLPCWKDMIGSTDIFTRGCTSNLCRKVAYNTYNNSGCNVSTSASDTYSGPGTGNNNFIGMYGGISTWNGQTTHYQEGVQTKLSTALVNGQQYIVSFWAKVNKDYAGIGNASNRIAVLDFYGLSGFQPMANNINSSYSAVYPTSSQLGNSMQITNDNSWHYMQQTFTYNGPNGYSYMGLYYNVFDPLYNGITSMDAYVYVDDVALNVAGSIPLITPSPTICLGQSISNLANYVNMPGGVFTGQGVSFANGIYSFNSAGLAAGNYNVLYTYTNPVTGCVTTQGIIVPLANGTISVSIPSQTICSSTCTTLVPTVSGTAPFTYQWNTAPVATTSAVTVCPNISKNYKLSITNLLGCVATATASITVNQTPTLSVSDRTLCATLNYTLAATGATNYTWLPATNLSCTTCANPAINTTVSTIYSVTGTSNGCSTTKTMSVFVRPRPMVISQITQTICAGTTVALTTSVNVSGGTYTWSTGATTPSISVSPVVTTSYIVQYAAPCGSSSSQGIITIRPLPTITISPSYIAFCAPTTTTLTAGYANATPNYALWNNGMAGDIKVVTPTVTTVYTASVSNPCGSAVDTATIVIGTPTLSIQQSVLYYPCGMGPVQASLNASGATSYTWDPPYALSSTAGANIIAIPTVQTTYTLYGQDASGCAGTETVNVQAMFPYPADAGPDVSICSAAGGSFVLGTLAQSGYVYNWDPPIYLNSIYMAQPSFNYAGGGTGAFPITYTLTTYNQNKCFSQDYVTVSLDYNCRLQQQTTEKKKIHQITAIPNPNNGNFEIISNEIILNAQVVITNVIGATVYNTQVSEFQNHKVAMDDMSAGIYYLHVIGNNEAINVTIKIIKQ